jgi:CheY-like chemotaxis protein
MYLATEPDCLPKRTWKKIMSEDMKNFNETAKSLARNPLGIIALFIVLVYGFASLVTAFAGSFTSTERLPLIYFLIVFPILVLGVFAWLVSNHSGKLFAPSDFKNEDNYVKMQMAVVASLTAATAKGDGPASDAQLHKIVEVVRATEPTAITTGDGWRNHILWVDDRPENNTHERQAFEALGLKFTLALSTREAFERLAQTKFAAIISDMGRREGPREGYVLLDRLRKEGDRTPLFFYASSNALEHQRETREHGGQGCTNNARELFEMVTRAIIQRQTAKYE